MTLDRAYEHCALIARKHYENFPVASFAVPMSIRRHLFALYAFSRHADDIADEGNVTAAERLHMLSDVRNALRDETIDHPIFIAVRNTVRECRLPLEPFDRLLDAFTQDVNFTPFSSWDDVLSYCNNSANPVGELFLRLAFRGQEPPQEAIQASDCVCTALQITNFLQDLGVDLARGRSYLPIPDSEVYKRTRELYRKGAVVTQHVQSWRLKLELWLIVQGGMMMLELCGSRTDRMQRPTLSLWTVILRYAKSRVRRT